MCFLKSHHLLITPSLSVRNVPAMYLWAGSNSCLYYPVPEKEEKAAPAQGSDSELRPD